MNILYEVKAIYTVAAEETVGVTVYEENWNSQCR